MHIVKSHLCLGVSCYSIRHHGRHVLLSTAIECEGALIGVRRRNLMQTPVTPNTYYRPLSFSFSLVRIYFLCFIQGLGLEQTPDGRLLVSSVDEGSPAKKASMASIFSLAFDYVGRNYSYFYL